MNPLDLESELNPEQVAAVTHAGGPQLVLAGAGSGKTRVITYRVAWLAREQGVDPHRIVAVTFTNKAAAEMRERVEGLLGLYPLPTFVGTFHRYALGMLRRWGERVGLKRDFAIMDSSDQISLVKQALTAEGLSEKAFPPRSMLSAISSAKNRLVTPNRYEAEASDFFTRKVALVYRRYQGLLQQVSGVDFDDMIALAVRLLEEEEDLFERVRRRTEHLLVDEFQDTNHAQLRLVERVIGADGNLTAVGDEDQGIYRWRGAELDHILRFEDTFPEATVRKLERNYRSTQNILDLSGELIAKNEKRRGKRLWTEAGAGALPELYKASDEGDEARWAVDTLQSLRGAHELSDMAILVRTNAQTRALEEELLRQEVPYDLVGGTRFYDRAEIKDLVAYLRVLRNPRDSFSLQRIINRPTRGIGKATLEMLHEEAASRGLQVWDLVYQEELGNFPTRSTNALTAFRALVLELQEAAAELELPELLERLLDRTRYTDLYDRNDPDGLARLENIEELLSAAQEFTEARQRAAEAEPDGDRLTEFLDHVSLVSDIDTWQARRGVSVMTLHSAKGLEFPVVIVTGLEDGLLPHFNAQGTPEDLEEERRLLYVGMTRAEERLLLSCCRRRRIAGRYQPQDESPFLDELPEHLLEVTESPQLFASASPSAGNVYSFFGGGGGGGGRRRREPAGGNYGGIEGFTGGGDQDLGSLARGSRVQHPTLGQGVVLETEGEGDHAKLVVVFDRAGKRKLVARYANLEPI